MKLSNRDGGLKTRSVALKTLIKEYFIIFAWVILCAILTFVCKGKFLTSSNFFTMLRQASIVAIAACGQYFIMIGGAFDLSTDGTVALSGVIFADLIVSHLMHPVAAALVALVVGALIGLLNGIMITRFNIPAFIATLATLSITQGLTFVYTNATPVTKLPKTISWLGRGVIGDLKTFGVPIPVIIMVLVFVLAWIVADRMNFGRKIYALGGNREAAYLSGINTKRYTLLTFVIASVLAAFASVILVSRLDSGHPSSGAGYAFDTVTACVIGGVSLTGGKGKAINVMFGMIFLTTFFNGMTLLNVNTFYQDVLKGVVLAAAVGMDTFRNKSKA